MDKILIGKGNTENYILLNKINRHGLISGATGTGKTVTLKVLTEGLSDAGVPTILADVKGDLANISKPGAMNDKLNARLEELGIPDFDFKSFFKISPKYLYLYIYSYFNIIDKFEFIISFINRMK